MFVSQQPSLRIEGVLPPTLSVAVLAATAVAHPERSTNKKENTLTRLLLAAPTGGHDDDDNLLPTPPASACPSDHCSTPRTRPPTTALLLTPEEAARRLSIGRTTIYALMASGDLPSVTIGRCRRIPVSALKSFVVRLGDEASGDRKRWWHYGAASESTAR